MQRLEYRPDGLAAEERNVVNRLMNMGIKVDYTLSTSFLWDSVGGYMIAPTEWVAGMAGRGIMFKCVGIIYKNDFWEFINKLSIKPRHIIFQLGVFDWRLSDTEKERTGKLTHNIKRNCDTYLDGYRCACIE